MGLNALAIELAKDGDVAAPTYTRATKRVANGISKLFDANKKAFKAADVADDGQFYADRTCQIYPQLYDVPLGSAQQTRQKYDAAYAYLNARGDKWEIGQIKDDSLGGYPWMVLGTVAAKRGDTARAVTQLNYYLDKLNAATSAPPTPQSSVFTTIQELGFATQLQNTPTTVLKLESCSEQAS